MAPCTGLQGFFSPATWASPVRWAVLAVLSLLLAAILVRLRLPAATLLGPMAAAILLAGAGRGVRVARPVFLVAQGVVGVMIAGHLPPSIVHEVASGWPVFLAGTGSTLVAATLLGWALMRSGVLPGTTAIWGSSPGAAPAMIVMSDSGGADMRLVAFMQYLRVVACAVIAMVVARVMGGGAPAQPVAWLPELSGWRQAGPALAIVLCGTLIGGRLPLPGTALLAPMALAMLCKLTLGLPIMLPAPVLATGFCIIGWVIGLRFSADALRHVARVFPRVLASILALIAICGGFAALLVLFAGVDPLTAYLATSPGGADSVAIIASSVTVDIPFIMTMQIGRFILVIAIGPALARRLARGNRTGPGSSCAGAGG
ncbi:MAG: AbrB family transcriptional regulator [Telmatospirillum sp.]|nr:AbrB family transcriptional regulator [Telmatospirillum sp.]